MVVIAIGAIGLILLLTGDEDEKDEENNKSPDVELNISTDKTTYNFQENANVTVTTDNKMNRDFPYGDYKFDFFIVEKEEYDSISYSYIIDSEYYGARQTIETLTISEGDFESVTITWVLDTDNYQGPGKYFFVFRIEKDIGDNQSIIIESEEALITIIE